MNTSTRASSANVSASGRVRRQHRVTPAIVHLRNQDAERAAEAREQDGFAEQLADEVPPRGADRQTHGHFAGAAHGFGQQQVRDVRARAEQHDERDAQQEHERHERLFRRAALAARARAEFDDLGLESLERRRAHALLQRRLHVVDDRRDTAG